MGRSLCFHRAGMRKQVLTRQRVLELIDQLQVGEAIPSERRLSSELGISRPPPKPGGGG